MMEVREQRDGLIQRIPRLRLAFSILLVLIGTCYWFVQVVQGSYYRELADNNRLNKVPINAPRGLIFDRNELRLVDNVPSYDLLLDRSLAADLDASLDFAVGILGRPRAALEETLIRYRSSSLFTPILIAESLSLSQVARFSAERLEHPEFDIDVGHLRVYRHGPLTAHLLGYLGEVTPADLAADDSPYVPGDLAGKRGVELAYESRLRGTDGERVVVVDSRGRPRSEYRSTLATPGADLELTLDLELQQEAARYFEDKVGAAVALDPRNGDVLVMVSAPSYNPNSFARRLDQSEWQALVEAPNNPLQNRALQNTHSPGSLFKIVVATAGLSDGVVDRSDSVFCGGSTTIYNRRFRCWKRGGHGWMRIRDAIKESCDVYFYHLGQKLGISRIAEFARRFGLGQQTGIAIAGEKQGLVPDLDWSLRVRGTTWYPGETISVAIGQGPLLATPLQIASMMAIVANGGFKVVPRLDRDAPIAAPQALPLDPAALEMVREALWAVVNEKGTGASARVGSVEVAGKTGTVQVVEQKSWIDSDDLPFELRDHAWFASFAPADHAEMVVVVFVEHGGKGSRVAAPLAKILYERHFDDRGTHQPS
jgi:penicillin-binding protein 2